MSGAAVAIVSLSPALSLAWPAYFPSTSPVALGHGDPHHGQAQGDTCMAGGGRKDHSELITRKRGNEASPPARLGDPRDGNRTHGCQGGHTCGTTPALPKKESGKDTKKQRTALPGPTWAETTLSPARAAAGLPRESPERTPKDDTRPAVGDHLRGRGSAHNHDES